MLMNVFNKKTVCADVNRECELVPFERISEVQPETRRVVDYTIGSDDITHSEETGRFFRTKTSGKRCKFCGREVDVVSKRIYGKMGFIGE